MSKRLDLIGKKFGRLEVIAFSEIRNNKTYWLTKCTCNKLKIIRGSKIINYVNILCINCDVPIRFWSKVDKNGPNGCWLWTGARNINRKGELTYGRFSFARKAEKAHRVAYVLSKGPIPLNKPNILHTCDNPGCVNPEHLFAGTDIENMQDMIIKGRKVNSSGIFNGQAKLSYLQVLEIRWFYSTGKYSYKDLSQMFNVSIEQIRRIVKKENWK